MEQLFLVPVCSKEAVSNIDKSLKVKIDLNDLCKSKSILLSEIIIRGHIHKNSKVNVWGTTKDKIILGIK